MWKNTDKQQKESFMKKQDLTKDEQMVLSYLVLIDEYVKRNSTSEDDEAENSLYDLFIQVFDGMGENGEKELQWLFYENLISLNEKNYINFEDSTDTSDKDYIIYRFISLAICKKGTDYGQKYMKLDKEELKIAMRKIPKFSLQDIADVCTQINNSELLKFVSSLVAFGTAIK